MGEVPLQENDLENEKAGPLSATANGRQCLSKNSAFPG